MSATELFRTADVAVRQWTGFSATCCFVTFDSFTDLRSLDRLGFAEGFLGEHGIDAVHILSRDNDWYQYPDFLEICARVRALTAGYERVVAYGSSMGGYAAIRFGKLVGAETAFAVSPQFSIDPQRVPFEYRWKYDARRVTMLFEADPPPFVDTAIIAYDLNDLDARHVELFRGLTDVVDVRLRNTGHPSTGYLAQLGLLQQSCLRIARGEFDATWLSAEARAHRKQAGQFYVALSLRAREPATRVRLMEIAVEKAPRDFGYLAQLATLAATNRDFDKAEDALERGMALAPAHPVVQVNRSVVLELKGDLDGALDVMTRLVRTSGLYQDRLDSLRAIAERADAATWIAPKTRALDPEPRDAPSPGWSLARFRRKLAGTAFRMLHGRGLPPNSRRTVLPAVERVGVEARVTTFPSPPPFAASWRRHDYLVRAVPRRPIDLLLVGDSLVEQWADGLWSPRRVFNYGVAADKLQHVIWRVDEITRRIDARRVLVLAGTNNLGAGDTPEGMLAGMAELLRRLSLAAPGAETLVVEIPPCGPAFDFRDADRRQANALLRDSGLARTINVDSDLVPCEAETNPFYQPDHIHFSDAGYARLTSRVIQAWD